MRSGFGALEETHRRYREVLSCCRAVLTDSRLRRGRAVGMSRAHCRFRVAAIVATERFEGALTISLLLADVAGVPRNRVGMMSDPEKHLQCGFKDVLDEDVNVQEEWEVTGAEVKTTTRPLWVRYRSARHLARIRSTPHSLVARLDRPRFLVTRALCGHVLCRPTSLPGSVC